MPAKSLELSLIGEWFDPHPQILKRYLIKYHVESNEVEMTDLTAGRRFLKRTSIPPSASISEQDCRVGGHVILFSRNMKIVDYGDEETRQILEASTEETVVVLSSQAVAEGELGKVVELMEGSAAGLQVVMMKVLDDTAIEGSGIGKQYATDGAVAIIMQGEDSVDKARRALANDGRYMYGTAVFCSATKKEASKLREGLFKQSDPSHTNSNESKPNPNEGDCTCCVIKPHAIKSRQVGAILQSINAAGYDIDNLGLFHLDENAAREFLEVYEGGAVKNLHLMVQEMCSGPVIALRLCRTSGAGASTTNEGTDKDVVSAFRTEVAGPWDIEMAKELHPTSIRARYGIDNVKNAVHCTDLPNDGESECQFFFEILAGA